MVILPWLCLHNAISLLSLNLLLQKERSMDFYGDLMFFLELNILLFHPACACIILSLSLLFTTAGHSRESGTHTQCEFQLERHFVVCFDHFTDEFFQRAVHVSRSQVDHSIVYSHYMEKRTGKNIICANKSKGT